MAAAAAAAAISLYRDPNMRISLSSTGISKVSRSSSIGMRKVGKQRMVISAASPSPSPSPSAAAAAAAAAGKEKEKNDDVEMISTGEELDKVLKEAKSKLVVIEYATSDSINSKRIYPAMVELSRACTDVVFKLILGDESDETKKLFERAGVKRVPHFIFYKSMEKVHEEEGMTEDKLLGDVLYYGESPSQIKQLHSREEVEALIAKHSEDGKLIVLDVGLKHCGPCVKVYPTVVKLARKMADTTVFGRMHGDESDDCMALLKELNVIEVPTFLFIRDGKPCGRYVGSGKGELIGEILKYQGVCVS